MDFFSNEIWWSGKELIEVHYLKWDPQECYYYAADNTGFEANIILQI